MNITNTHDKFILLWDKGTLEVPVLNAKLYMSTFSQNAGKYYTTFIKNINQQKITVIVVIHSRASLYTLSSKDL